MTEPAYRGGSGEPLVLLHGLTASWRIWEPVLPALEAEHAVFAPTLAGHLGGTPWAEGTPVSISALADTVEAQLDAEGIDRAHLAGNSLGGWLVLELARRGRARSVVALSPAGAWERPRDLARVVRLFKVGSFGMAHGRGLLEALAQRPRSRKLLLGAVMEHGERIPARVAIEQLDEALGCLVLPEFLTWVAGQQSFAGPPLPDDVPVRIAWGEQDKTIPFARYGRPYVTAIPGAELVLLPGAGHVPMYDDPAGVVRTILEVTRAAATPTPPKEQNIPTSTELTGAAGRVHLHRWSAEQPTFGVVLAHGHGEHAGRYDHVAAALVGAGAVVIAPDHAGHGRSDGEPASLQSMEPVVDDLAAARDLLREEHPGLPLVLMGHSMGGIIATRLAQRDPSAWAALVLSGPAIGGNPDIQGMLALDPLPEVPIDPAVLSRDPAVGEAYMADPLVYDGPFRRETLEAMFGAVDAIAEGPSLGALPTIWVHGEEDALAPVGVTREALHRIRGDELEEHVYPGARHEVLNETNKDEVLGDVLAFLSRTLPS